MDDSVLTEYVIRELGRHVSRNDLIFDLCHRTGMSWDQAAKFVAEIEQTHRRVIARKQSPLFLVIGVGIFLGGVWAFCGGVLYFLNFMQAGSISINPLDLRRDYVNLIRVGTGLAMIVGSSIGVTQLVLSMMGKTPPKA